MVVRAATVEMASGFGRTEAGPRCRLKTTLWSR